ncbi:penicillin-binding protein [Bacillus sp. HMF5848]|uniref:penicillin-binding protein n=1 Tax=Bacillus sp. HMF5848 TaxID=2495421 RepID=UPI000F7A6FAB|nr:penicillin-binding protein [Bacillus sp. HMF5848]RSK26935.1 penicillin-binding protein [Bacillus sp. HMF5848]
MYYKNKNINRGAALISLLFTLLFLLLFGRFLTIQASGEVDGNILADQALKFYTKERTVEANRGTIIDRNKSVIAEDTSSYTLVAILNKDAPSHVENPQKTAELLAPLLQMSVNEVYSNLTKDRYQVEFGKNGRDISHTLKNEIDALALPGITFIRDTKRFYPHGVFASHVVGYAEKKVVEQDDSNKKEVITKGVLGLEASLNDYLEEQDGKVVYKSDKSGLPLPNIKPSITPPKNGQTVELTLDEKIQTFLEDSMNNVQEKFAPEKIIGIVANAKTGEILAMGTRPSFDLNTRAGISENWNNDAVFYRFEPGSTMKMFTLAAAIEEGVYNPTEIFQSGSYAVGTDIIRDHNKLGWGKITFEEGFQRSSNVAFSIIAKEKLGLDVLREYLTRFGLDRKTNIDVPGESEPIVNFKYELDKVSTAFGQGTAITPIQQIQAATAIANNGQMMKPYVINRIIDPETKDILVDNKPTVVGEPISSNTASQVRKILGTVLTAPHGTGKPYVIDGYEVAGKTGTAQIPDPEGGYLSGHQNFIFSFLGMAPVDDPELIVYVAVKKPNITIHEPGSLPVSMIFKPVMKNSLQYLNIRPSKQNSNKESEEIDNSIKIKDYRNLSVQATQAELTALGMEPVIIGEGTTVLGQLPKPNSKVIFNEKVLFITESSFIMPDLNGWSLRDVMKLVAITELQPNIIGNGYVTSQNIMPGVEFEKGDYLILDLAPPETIHSGINDVTFEEGEAPMN